jgi:hypothetical protein
VPGGGPPRRSARVAGGTKPCAPPGLGGRRGGRGHNPVREVLLPVQRELGELRRREPVRGSGGSTRLCSRAVLVAEVDERHLVQSLNASGSSPRPRARRVKGRRKPVRGGKAAGTVAGSRRSRSLAPQGVRGRGSEHSSREGVLVSTKRSPLTGWSWRRAWRLHETGPAERLDPVRAEAATEGVRGHAMGSVRGRELRRRVASRGEAFDRGFARTAQRSFPSSPTSGANTPAA